MISPPPIRHILVPHDFGDAAEAALVYATRFASAFGARITLLHASDDPAEGADAAADLVSELEPDLSEKIGRQASKALEKVAARVRVSGVEVTTKVRCGRPWRETDSEATERHFDLIVIGTHGRRGVAHALLGSVAEKIVRTAPCPVVTIRGSRR